MVLVAKRHPEAPYEIWVSLPIKAWEPVKGSIPLRTVRMSGKAFEAGIEVHTVDGTPVRMYSPAKTVADCFKFRSKVGLDVALEALREYQRSRSGSVDDLWHYARICRVQNVMRPYLEASTGGAT